MPGPAIVKLADGSTFVSGTVQLDAGAVTVTDGRLRIIDLTGERLYAPKTFTVPVAAVKRIEWLEPEPQAARHLAAA